MAQADAGRGTDTATESSPVGRGNRLWELKVRLQFTGWLQYVPPTVVAVVLIALAGVGALVAWPVPVVAAPLTLGGVLLAVTAFDLLTVKLGVRPHEARPPALDLDAFDAMRARRSCRSFQPVDLTAEDREAVLSAAATATRPERLLGSAAIRLEYVAVRLTVWPVVGAHEFLVAIAPRAYDRTAVIDIGRSLQQVVLDATPRGVATCWIGPGADQSSVASALGDRFDAERDHVVCVCAVGYRSRFVPLLVRVMNGHMHRRHPLTRLFFADAALTRPIDTAAAPYDAFGRCYEVCQWSPSSFNGQTTRATVLTDDDAVTQVDFRQATTSRFYAPVALGIWVANWEAGCAALGVPGRAIVLDDRPGYAASWVSV